MMVIPGCSRTILATSFWTLVSTSTSLDSLVLLTEKPTTGRSSSRANWLRAAEPSPTSATSESFTSRPATEMVRLRICSAVVAAPITLTVCSRPPTVTWPPGASLVIEFRAWLITGAVTPAAAILTGSRRMLISRLRPPTLLTEPTPPRDCSRRVRVSSMNQDRSSIDMSGA